MPTTPVYLIPYPVDADSPDGPAQMQAIADRLETLLGSIAPDQLVDDVAGKIIVVGATGAAAYRAMSGDATINSGGVLTIANDAITSAKIAADAVGWSELAANAVGNVEIGDGAVYGAKIPADAITATHIGPSEVGSSEINQDAVGSSEIAPDAVGTSEIAAGAVGSSEIADGSVGMAELANDSVDTNKIVANGVGASELADNAVDTAAIAAGAVGGTQLGADSVNAAKIVDGSVGTAELGNGIVTPAKLTSVSSRLLCNSDLTLTTVAQDVSGCTYTAPSTGLYLVLASMYFQMQATDAAAALGRGYGTLVVNGATQSSVAVVGLAVPAGSNNSWWNYVTCAQSWLVSATAGHVIKLQGKKAVNTGTINGIVTATETSMTVLQLG